MHGGKLPDALRMPIIEGVSRGIGIVNGLHQLMGDDPEIWLRYYANEEERQAWAEETQGYPPQIEDPPYPRRLPRAPL